MDLVDTLRKKIDVLEDGEYVPGLKAVLLHIETAFGHLSRGREADEETAFTDAIYRTNQAFEGSIKEAYRVLAGQDPAKKRPYDIESYLEQKNVFRSRVLSQLTTYRTEWRNPSAHDYKLDFDESEAFLAIVSVSAFACLLLDQIAERLAFARSLAEAEAQKDALANHLEPTVDASLLVHLAQLLSRFCAMHTPPSSSSTKQTELQFIGALHGFLASAAPDLDVKTDARLVPEKHFRADLLVSRNSEKVVVELKRRFIKPVAFEAMAQVQNYMLVGGINNAVLLFLPQGPSDVEQVAVPVGGEGKLVILAPLGSNLALHFNADAR